MLKALTLAIVACFAWNQRIHKLERLYDSKKNLTTIRLMRIKLSGEKDRYHSLHFRVGYSFTGDTPDAPAPPETVNFELTSVVKARSLNSDLYVVFVADGKRMHFSSNRSAIRNPVRGRPWVGEKIVFQIPRAEFTKLVSAKKLAIKMGDVTFDFSEEALLHLTLFEWGIDS